MKSRKIEINEEKTSLRGIAIRADVPDIKGRIYPKDVIQKAMEKFQKKNGWVTFILEEPRSKMQLLDIVGEVSDFSWEGEDLILEAKLLNTPRKKLLMEVLDMTEHSLTIRGMGTIPVCEDYVILSVDFANGKDVI